MRILKIVSILIIVFTIYCIWQHVVKVVQKARNASIELICHSKFDCLGVCIGIYLDKNHSFPDFRDSKGQETWSWRTVIPMYTIDDIFCTKIDLNSSWKSENNRKLLEESSIPALASLKDWFSCGFFTPNNKKTGIVAVKGKGSLWTEVNRNSCLLDQKEYIKGMIIAIEILPPTNEWYEPGDDVSPEIVLDMYRNYCDKTFQSPHEHIYFLTIDGPEEFAQIKTEAEMIKRLYVNEDITGF